ncbi:bacteriocin class II family protein, partial [Streptococcus mutans]
MNTQAFEQFNVMDNEALSVVEGGGRGWNCA